MFSNVMFILFEYTHRSKLSDNKCLVMINDEA